MPQASVNRQSAHGLAAGWGSPNVVGPFNQTAGRGLGQVPRQPRIRSALGINPVRLALGQLDYALEVFRHDRVTEGVHVSDNSLAQMLAAIGIAAGQPAAIRIQIDDGDVRARYEADINTNPLGGATF